MRGFSLLELLVVLFIITTIMFIAFPSFWREMAKNDNVAVASALRNLREEAIAVKKETFFTIDFRERQFRTRGAKGILKDSSGTIAMQEDETWEIFIPSRGTIKEGEVTVVFSPSVQEEVVALYRNKSGSDTTITLNNLSGEVEIEEGIRKFDE